MAEEKPVIKAIEFILTLAEGPHQWVGRPVKVKTWGEASIVLSGWKFWLNRDEKMSGSYKTDFAVTFDNGNVYSGQYDIELDKVVDLASHVREFLGFMSGQICPSGWTDRNYRLFLSRHKGETLSRANEILATCQIGD